MLAGGPLLEDGGELMVGDDDVFRDFGDVVDVIKHTPQYGGPANLEEGFGEISRQFP